MVNCLFCGIRKYVFYVFLVFSEMSFGFDEVRRIRFNDNLNGG